MDGGQVGRKVRCIPRGQRDCGQGQPQAGQGVGWQLAPDLHPPGLEGRGPWGQGAPGLGLPGVGSALFQRVMLRPGPSSWRRMRSCRAA